EEEEEEEELEAFDVIVDAYGSQDLWYAARKWLKPGPGHVYVSVGPALEAYTFRSAVGVLVKQMLNRFLPVWLGGIDRQYRQVTAWVDVERLERLRVLAEEGVLKTWIGGAWGFENAIEAYEVLLSKHAKGKLIIRVQDEVLSTTGD
ncbi:uncharacterized protein BO66DRAFT_444683, partial [Aspergillus aculeatinus CBS 121060]